MTGLRARGGLQVDLAWRDGRLEQAVVRRIAGAGPCTVAWNGQSKTAELQPGEQLTWRPQLARAGDQPSAQK